MKFASVEKSKDRPLESDAILNKQPLSINSSDIKQKHLFQAVCVVILGDMIAAVPLMLS